MNQTILTIDAYLALLVVLINFVFAILILVRTSPTMLEAGVGYGTLDLNIKMLKVIPLEKELAAEGRVIHLSKKIGVSEGLDCSARPTNCRLASIDLLFGVGDIRIIGCISFS